MAIFAAIITKHIGGIWGDRSFGMVIIEFMMIRGLMIGRIRRNHGRIGISGFHFQILGFRILGSFASDLELESKMGLF